MIFFSAVFPFFLSVFASLLKDRYTAFIYVGISWMAPWVWHLFNKFQEYWSEDDSDTESDVSNWEES